MGRDGRGGERMQNVPSAQHARLAATESHGNLCTCWRSNAAYIRMAGSTYSAVGHPSPCLHQGRRAEVFVRVPPVTRARRAAARTQNAFVHAVQQFPVLLRLEMFLAPLWLFARFQVRLDGFALLVEVGHVWDQVIDDIPGTRKGHGTLRGNWERGGNT